MERANDLKSRIDWMADFTEDELAVYEKYASKYADKVSLMGTPNGSLGMVALGMKGVGQQAPILRFLQAAPWFINAPLNLTNMLYDSIPLVGLSRAASFMIKGRRGLLVSDKAAEQLGLFRREDNERLYKEQRNSLLKRVAALQVASITGLMLAGFFDDDEEKDKYKTITDYIKSKGIYMTGSLSVNPEKLRELFKRIKDELPSLQGGKLLAMNPDGVFFSNGPGDPEPCDYAIAAAKEIIEKGLPTFGICLGHQIMGLAAGAKTLKMKFGHHGANHPVKDVDTGRVAITSQNHGFAVDASTLPKNIRVTHVSLFDGSLQGLAWEDKPALCFQGHPEASPGPHDIAYLFDRFVELMNATKAGNKGGK
jgi:anthranilate/para-aminobenzoate synthase component II